MTQIEKRILELEFDNSNFEASVKTSMDTLDKLQAKLEMKEATGGLDKIERKANDISFKGMQDGISDASLAFESFSESASDDIDRVENRMDRFSTQGIAKSVSDTSSRFTKFSVSAQGDVAAVQNAIDNTTLSAIAEQIQELSNKFKTLGVIGMSVLNELTRSAMAFGKSMIGKVLDPIIAGGKNRAMAIENAHFSLQGLISDEAEVQAIMKDALDSVDGTAYAYNDAASAAAQFAATGLRSGEEMQQTLRAIAGVAATTNAEYSDIAHIFTTIAGNGRVMGEQLNQFSYRGLNAAATMTKAFNEVLNGSSNLSSEMQDHIRDLVKDGMANITRFSGSLEGITEGDLRELVSKGKLDFETFSQIMATTFGDHAKDANKTFNGAMSNIRSALARTGAMFYSDLIVQEGPLVKMFNAIREAVNALNKALPPLAKYWTESVSSLANGVTEIITAFVGSGGMAGVATLIEHFVEVLKTLGDAAAEVFGLKNWNIKDTIGAAAKTFQEWAKAIKPTEAQLDKLKRVASGVFALFKIGAKVVGTIASIFGKLLHALAPLGSVLVDIAADFGDWVVSVSNFIEKTGVLRTIVSVLSDVFETLGTMIANAADGIYTLFRYISKGVKDLKIFDKMAERISGRFDDLRNSGNGFYGILDKIKGAFSHLRPIFDTFGELLSSVGKKIKDVINGLIDTGDFNALISTINNGLLSGLLVAFIRFVNSLTKPAKSLKDTIESFKELPNTIASSLDKMKDSFKGMAGIDANALIKVAIAIGLLAASLLLLGKLDLQSTVIGLTALGGVMLEFMAFMKAWTELSSKLKDQKGIIRLSIQLMLVAVAIDIMASALAKLAKLKPQEIIDGILGLAAAMKILVTAVEKLNEAGDLKATAGKLILLAIAISLLSIPIKSLSKIPFGNLVKGLLGLAGAAAALVIVADKLKDLELEPKVAASMLIFATAMIVMAKAVSMLGSIPFEALIQGLATVAVMLAGTVEFIKNIKSEDILKTAASMVVLGVALEILADVISKLSAIPCEGLQNGLATVGIVLLEIASFVELIDSSDLLEIAASMVVMGVALEIIANVINNLGGMSSDVLAQGLEAIAVSLVLFAAACQGMEDALPAAGAIALMAVALIPLAVALTMLSLIPIPNLIVGLLAIVAVFALFGVMAYALSEASFAILALSGALVGLGVACLLIGAGIGIAAAGIAMLVTAIATGGAAIVAVIVMLINQLPNLFANLALAIVAFLKGLADSVVQLKTSLVTIGLALIQTFTELTPALVASIVQFVTSLVTTFTENAPTIAASVLQCINAILWAVADNIQSIVEAGISIAVNFINGISESIGSVIDAAFKLVISFINGLADAVRNNHNAMFDAVGNLISAFVEAVIDGVTRIANSAKDMIGGFFQGIAEFDIPGKIKETAENLINGFVNGIKGLIDKVGNAAKEVGDAAINGIKNLLGIHSPSTVFHDIGSNTGEGFIQGFDGKRGEAENSSAAFANGVLGKFQGKEGEAESAGSAISGGVVKGLQANGTNYGTTATAQIGNFLAQIDQAAGSALSSGIAVTGEVINGLMSNAGQYGDIAMSQISDFVNFIANGFGPANAAGMNVTGGVVQGLQVNAGDYAVTGDQQAAMFVQNVDGQTGAATNAGVNVTSGAVGGLQSNAGEYDATGNDDGNRFVGGLSAGNWHDAQGTGRSLAEQGKEGAGSVSYDGVGQDAGQGFANGLGSGSAFAAVGRAASALAQHAAGFLESVLHIGSPSKLFKQYGIWCGEGLANGFYASIPVAVEASGELGTMAIDSFTEALSPLNNLTWDIFEDEIEPTITPVVDMSNVVSAGKQFNDIFDQAAIFANIDGLAQSAAASFDIGKTKAHSDAGKTEVKEGTNITATWIVNGGQDPERFARQAMRSMKQLARSEGRERK